MSPCEQFEAHGLSWNVEPYGDGFVIDSWKRDATPHTTTIAGPEQAHAATKAHRTYWAYRDWMLRGDRFFITQPQPQE